MTDDFPPRYYALSPLKPTDPDTYFRLSSGGRYDRWDSASKTWIHMTDPAARDFYSRAIQNGDGAWEVDRSDVH